MPETSKPTTAIRVIDNDQGEITIIAADGRELRGWSYSNDEQRRMKMLCAHEFREGWYVGYSAGMDRVASLIDQHFTVVEEKNTSPESTQ